MSSFTISNSAESHSSTEYYLQGQQKAIQWEPSAVFSAQSRRPSVPADTVGSWLEAQEAGVLSCFAGAEPLMWLGSLARSWNADGFPGTETKRLDRCRGDRVDCDVWAGKRLG